MKNIRMLFTFFITMALGAINGFAASELVEVSISKVFVPEVGYDDNDTVQLVLDGALPNTCYSAQKVAADVDEEKKVISIVKYASLSVEGECSNLKEQVKPQFITPVPFNDVETLGQLTAGEYTIIYKGDGMVEQRKTFNVDVALVAEQNALPYAAVTEVSVPDYVPEQTEVLVTLRGTLNNSCYRLNKEVAVGRTGDVIIMKPTVDVIKKDFCLMVQKTFTIDVPIGKFEANRFDVQVRKMDKKLINRSFSVIRSEVEKSIKR